ncbi:class I glutamine amidotransferase-like protein [Coccomyxa subellipsoidea C-169]|uniref:Class I glutamine amidotransferase-like protein n=1 Tax=Coccomyxa subellipsoidea (strain C-169) TaxID=574566 RepID=I0YZF0_COCSC|nr:class I glutamine amidotransferase-like protein [Coccomyxa subellipsoidea C-169]EIE23769.1 class I glutamine amidotransferase-like protein [Coccomyxa subellipsoidea C-169]|eukprot:XP_005648313.1 class I glutamine amidotransferase-like protein [Coccomyxa subellipsoidea C-169]
MGKKVLTVSTSADALGGDATGLWLEELAAPYLILKSKGHDVTIASVKGGKIPLDPTSMKPENVVGHAQTFLDSKDDMALLEDSVPIAGLSADDFDAIYIPGGHGVAVDGPFDLTLRALISDFAAKGKIVSAVCHGPVAFSGPKVDGKPIVAGKRVTCFSDSEENTVGKSHLVPFLPEARLRELGGLYEKGDDWTSHVVVDGKLITGQNPQSSEKIGEAIAEALAA